MRRRHGQRSERHHAGGCDSAGLGSNEETLNDYSSQLATLNNNLAAANSPIMDVNVATESTNYAKENILVQTGTAMLAQANALPADRAEAHRQ